MCLVNTLLLPDLLALSFSTLIFALGGYAGTGKTTMAKYIRDQIRKDDNDKVLFCAFTGKAALNLREKGLRGASTIHRLIYKRDETLATRTQWLLDYESTARKADLIIVDEYSMLNKQIIDDLLTVSEKAKILCLGDPAQLPPIEGKSPITHPNVMLTEVHRQALDCPVLEAATYIRQNGKLPDKGRVNEHGCFSLISATKQNPEILLKKFDQVLVATNEARNQLNFKMRRHLFLDCDNQPRETDKMICLQNNYYLDIYNGQVGKLTKIGKTRNPKPMVLEKAEFTVGEGENACAKDVKMLVCRDMSQRRGAEYDGFTDFDYGYAITCHKSQGSEWDSIGVFPGRNSNQEWLYTAVTRARKNCVMFV